MAENGERAKQLRCVVREVDRSQLNDRRIDGAWWPHSLSLAEEVVDLLECVARAGFDTRRITYCEGAWSAPPRVFSFAGHDVGLGGSLSQQPDTITLVDGTGWDRLEILVIPPDWPDAAADLALRAVSRTDGDEPGEEMLAAAYAQAEIATPQAHPEGQLTSKDPGSGATRVLG